MFQIEVIDTGFIETARMLSKTAQQARSFKRPLRMIRTDVFRIEEALLRSQGRRGGGSWKRLRPDTRRKKGSSRIIYTAGAREGYSEYGDNTLVKSLTQLDAPFHHSRVEHFSLTFGTDRPYAHTHQYGSSARHIPARPLVRFTEQDQQRWIGWIGAHMMRPYRGQSAHQ